MNTTGPLPRLRGAALFLVLCLLVQGGLYLLFSEPCAAWICSAAARISAERVELDDDGVLEYHALRGPVGSARLLVVGCDSGAAGTSELVMDFLTFVKRCVNVRTLVIDLPEYEVELLNLYLGGDPVYPADVLRGCCGVTTETCALIEGIADLNSLLPPARQFSLRSSELSWTLGGQTGEPFCYLADRSLGAAPLGELDVMLAHREGVVTLDIRYQASSALAGDGSVRPLNETGLPFGGQAGSVWLVEYDRLDPAARFYRFVVTRTRGGRLAGMADAMLGERGDYALVLVGAEASAPLE